MNYKYSVSVILKNGFIDTKNSFLNQEKSIYEQTRNYILENEDDEDLRKLFTDFENNKNEEAGIWLDYSDYSLPNEIEKVYVTKIGEITN
jgi:hypothetical protein